MEASRGAQAARQRQRGRAVVLPRAKSDLTAVSDLLRFLGFDAVTAYDSQAARDALLNPPDLFITELGLKLDCYESLQLVWHAKAHRSESAALVIGASGDTAVRDDAEQSGATLIVVPTTRQEWVAAILRTVAQARSSTAGERIRPPFERRRSPRRPVNALAPGAQS